MKLDAIDKKILKYLQQDAKQTTKELSLKTNLSITAVYERIKKFEKNKVIKRYTVLLDKTLVGKDFTVFCHIKLTKPEKEIIQQFEKEISQLDEVMECFHVSGDYDYILKVHVADMNAFREFMVTKLTAIKSIGSTQSSISIGEVKNTTEFILF